MMDTQSPSSGLLCPDELSHRRCLNTTCGPTSLVDFVYHPSWLFDSRRTPTIFLGPLALPAPLLPLLVSVTFLYHTASQSHARRNQVIDIARLPPVPNQNNPQWPDFQHPDALRIYVAKANLAFHGIVTTGAIMHFGRSFLEIDTLCCAQVAALLFYAEFVRPEKWKSCLAAAAGWTLFTFLDQVPDRFAAVAAGLVVLLALPLAWQVEGLRGDVEHQQSGSVLLLMLMVANKVIFDSQAASEKWAKQHPMSAGHCVAALYVFNGIMTWVFNRNGLARRRLDADWDWGLQEVQATLRSCLSEILKIFCALVALLGPLAGGIVCTAFLTSCLPWSGLVFGKCASSPGLSLYAVGSGFYIHIGIWCVAELIRQFRGGQLTEKTPAAMLRHQLRLNADVIGWSCTFLNVLWMAVGILA
jgi:hypothetical protein